jgi:UPF0716 protein FxsA
MNVAKWVILAVLALPILELTVFIAVAATIGFGWALSLILAGSLCGALILRRAGGGHVARIRVALDHGSFTALQTDAWGGLTLLAGILLLIPGFITDIVALLLLAGSLRRAFVGEQPQQTGVVDLAPRSPSHRCLTVARMSAMSDRRKSLFPQRPYVSQPPRVA